MSGGSEAVVFRVVGNVLGGWRGMRVGKQQRRAWLVALLYCVVDLVGRK